MTIFGYMTICIYICICPCKISVSYFITYLFFTVLWQNIIPWRYMQIYIAIVLVLYIAFLCMDLPVFIKPVSIVRHLCGVLKYSYWFLEKEEGEGREKNNKPRNLWLGTEPATFRCLGWWLTKWARAMHLVFKQLYNWTFFFFSYLLCYSF